MSTDLLPTFTGGVSTSKNVLVFLSGFPDNERSAFGPILDNLTVHNKYDCYVISMCLPDHETNAQPKPWGYTIPKVLQMIDNTINHYVPEKNRKIILISHDWGSFFGFLYENAFPDKIYKLVNLDIGLLSKPPMRSLFLILLYQLWFAFSYFISQSVNFTFGNLLFKLFLLLLPASFRVTSKDEVFPRKREEVNVSHCYLYYYFWKDIVFNRKNALIPKFPSARILFMYGTRKNVNFHDDKFIKKIRQSPGSKYVAVESGHWIATQQPEIVTNEIVEFCELKRI